jgi:hypothetical protein
MVLSVPSTVPDGRSKRPMTEELFIASIAGVAALCGAIVGRIFAVEAPDRRTAVLAAGYCGAGAGLVSAIPFAFILVLVAKWWTSKFGFAALVAAVEAVGAGLVWGVAGGAGGGLLVGIVVALLKRRPPAGRGTPI